MYQIVTFLSVREPQKLKMVGNTWFYFDELGPFLVFIPCLTEKIGEFQLAMSKFSAFSGAKSNRHYMFQLFRSLEVTGHYISQLLEALKVMTCYIFQLFRSLKVMGCYISHMFSMLKVTGRYIFQLLETLKVMAVTFKK